MTQYETKDSGARAHFESGMQRDIEEGKPRFDLLHPLGVPYAEQFLTRCAALMGRGAEKYEDRNWEKANSEAELARFKSSAARHFEQWLNGEQDEDHAAGTFFNLLAHETTRYKLASNALESDDDDGTLGPEWEDIGYTTEEGVAEEGGFESENLVRRTLNDLADRMMLDRKDHPYALEFEIPTPFVDTTLFYGVVPKVEFKDPEPITLHSKAQWLAELEGHRMAYSVPRVDVQSQWFKPEPAFENEDLQPFLDALDRTVEKHNKAIIAAEEHVWAVRLEHTSFVSTPDGDVHDIRDMVQNALNRRD